MTLWINKTHLHDTASFSFIINFTNYHSWNIISFYNNTCIYRSGQIFRKKSCQKNIGRYFSCIGYIITIQQIISEHTFSCVNSVNSVKISFVKRTFFNSLDITNKFDTRMSFCIFKENFCDSFGSSCTL